MEVFSLKMILVLYLTGVISGGFQAFGFPWPGNQLPTSNSYPLDMALNSFDDQYNGCVKEMEEKLPDLLNSERNINQAYRKAWQDATVQWNDIQSKIPFNYLQKDYGIAVLVYTGTSVYGDFNKQVREAGQSRKHYKDNFHYKSLHYLLTRAIQEIWGHATQKSRHVYRGMSVTLTAKAKNIVRFGQFTSSSLDENKAAQFGKKTFFTIDTSYGAVLDGLSFFPNEKEVLIPPFEKFKVNSVTKTTDGSHIQLASDGIYSRYNCEYVKKNVKDELF